MAFKISSIGKTLMLGQIVNKDAAASWSLRLFTNDYTPVFGTVAADLTECTATGYAPITMTPASFVFTNPSAEIIKAQYPKASFFTTSANTCYGYFVMSGSTLIGAGRFASAITLPSGGELWVTLDDQIL
jgi:hypothetical protein